MPLRASAAESMSLKPGQGTKVLHATWVWGAESLEPRVVMQQGIREAGRRLLVLEWMWCWGPRRVSGSEPDMGCRCE